MKTKHLLAFTLACTAGYLIGVKAADAICRKVCRREEDETSEVIEGEIVNVE